LRTDDSPPPTRTLFLVAGLLAWGAIAQPFLLPFARDPGSLRETSVALSLAAHLAYLFAFLLSATRLFALSTPSRIGLLLVQSVSALALVHLRTLWLEAGLLAIVAALASLLLSRRLSLVWVFAQTVAVFPYYVGRADIAQAAFWTAGVLGFQLFATTIGSLARHEAKARAELMRVNAELRAADVMLEEGARTAERLRIARELHDAVGHHLTALSIQMELARHGCPNEPALVEAQGITKNMLAEVRAVVREMREDAPIDLPRAFETLTKGLSSPAVSIETKGEIASLDSVVAHALFRCVQEGLTNAIRHAGALHVWVSLEVEPDLVTLSVRDDGHGAPDKQEGSGLLGLRERVALLGGAFFFSNIPSSGVSLRIVIPLRRGAP
jgi:signal transduction histidine kinase